MVANDFHVPHHDWKALRLLEIFLADQKPEVFIKDGDFLDMWEVSQFDRVPKMGKSIMQEVRIGRKLLERFRVGLAWLVGKIPI